MKNTAVLLLSIPLALARKGVVAAIAQFLVAHNGSVLHTDWMDSIFPFTSSNNTSSRSPIVS
jgi:hypothetical protein